MNKFSDYDYDCDSGLYFPKDGIGYGLTFDELAELIDYVPAHDNKEETK